MRCVQALTRWACMGGRHVCVDAACRTKLVQLLGKAQWKVE